MKLIQAITMISQMIRNTVQPMKMKVIGLYFVILEKHFCIQIKIYLSHNLDVLQMKIVMGSSM